MRILYLSPDDIPYNLPFDTESIKKFLLANPNTIWYTIEEFTLAFNTEYISDLGLIYPISDKEFENIDKKEPKKEILDKLSKILTDYEMLKQGFKSDKISLKEYSDTEQEIIKRMYNLHRRIYNELSKNK